MGSRIAIVGTGGREQALEWILKQSSSVERVGLYKTPNADSFTEFADGLMQDDIDLAVIGPEQPLVGGLTDVLRTYSLPTFGPQQTAAELVEGSKIASANLMDDCLIPQAHWLVARDLNGARVNAERLGSARGVVFKANGLQGGKGVRVYDSIDEAVHDAPDFIDRFSTPFLVSERMSGPELSYFAISDGINVSTIPVPVQDHKRLLEDDLGPNTGGMGAYCPADVTGDIWDRDLLTAYVDKHIMTPLIWGLSRGLSGGAPFVGVVYAGLMVTPGGVKVVEFNCRFGDPEIQALTQLLDPDQFYRFIDGAARGKIPREDWIIKSGAAMNVVQASNKYAIPGAEVPKGLPIHGLSEARNIKGLTVFLPGAKQVGDQWVTSGGRVVNCIGYSPLGLKSAQDIAYAGVRAISFDGEQHRPDIGHQMLGRA